MKLFNERALSDVQAEKDKEKTIKELKDQIVIYERTEKEKDLIISDLMTTVSEIQQTTLDNSLILAELQLKVGGTTNV